MKIVRFSASSAPTAQAQWGLLEGDTIQPVAGSPYTQLDAQGGYIPQPVGQPIPVAQVRLLAPVAPTKIVCVGRNYAEHAAELGNQVGEFPLIFLKALSSLTDPGADVVHPPISQRVDYEGELALVIGRRCRNLSQAEARSVIFGYTIANDVTARDLQTIEKQWARAKGFDTFGPVGPWVDTDYDPANRQLRTLVNGEVRQDSNTDLMVFSIERVLAHITEAMTLEPGDLILTGTPSGVGPVQPGDSMTVTIDGLGELSNPVVEA